MEGDAAPIAVVGGGLAGLTAALDLAEAGAPVALFERRPFVGGKAFSFVDPQHGVALDNGQHITMRCCTAFDAFLTRIGMRGAVRYQRALNVRVIDPGRGLSSSVASLGPPLPAPWHLAWSILSYRHLSPLERARIGAAVLAMRRIDERRRRELDRRSFAEWLREHGQSPRVIERFWDLIILPTCNDQSANVSAAQAIQVCRTGFLTQTRAADIGLFRRGLGEIADAALARACEAGAQARLGERVERIELADGRAAAVHTGGGERIPVSGVVLALPPQQALEALPAELRVREPFWRLRQFSTSPIVNIHLKWSAPIMQRDFAAVLDPGVQFIFNRSALHGWPGPEQWISCSLSGAHEAVALPQDELVSRARNGLRRALRRAREAELLAARVVKETDATFRPAPGILAHRVGARTPIANLTLAGAWTDTGWPATMESAVRSGHAAAKAMQGAIGGAG